MWKMEDNGAERLLRSRALHVGRSRLGIGEDGMVIVDAYIDRKEHAFVQGVKEIIGERYLEGFSATSYAEQDGYINLFSPIQCRCLGK